MNWLKKYAGVMEACAAVVTAMIAVVALIGVKWQLDEADRLSALQSARDAYRGHLVLAAGTPAFAAPVDGCGLIASDQGAAYRAFVDHLLYSAEQMLGAEEGWDRTFEEQIGQHKDFFCSSSAPDGDSAAVAAVIKQFQASCPAQPTCE